MELDQGVRYVTVKVTTKHGVDSIAKEIEQALSGHKAQFEFSSAPAKVFKAVEVVNVRLGYQYDLDEQKLPTIRR